ncbi:MAG: hypothetical protein HY540_07350 [Deltaproteobacteria bacterium]|nr:hypothetical protein [Deltaproteobacteria bacterium]
MKNHPIIMILTAPIVSLVYVIFLPFIGFAMLFWIILKKLANVLSLISHRAFQAGGDALRKTVHFTWVPSFSYFAGRKKKEKP